MRYKVGGLTAGTFVLPALASVGKDVRLQHLVFLSAVSLRLPQCPLGRVLYTGPCEPSLPSSWASFVTDVNLNHDQYTAAKSQHKFLYIVFFSNHLQSRHVRTGSCSESFDSEFWDKD